MARHNNEFNLFDFLKKCDTISSGLSHLYILLPYNRNEYFTEIILGTKWNIAHKYIISNKVESSPIRVIYKLNKIENIENKEEFIYIYNSDNTYSSRFEKLLQPYYL